MYAVFRSGGHQYRAEVGEIVDVERLAVEEGDQFEISEVLLVADDSGTVHVGQPLVDGAIVNVTCLAQYRAKKIFVWKYRPKKRYRKRRGHRQYYTRLKIDSISV
jgi:large subunit ribosomal protein L21